MEFCQHIPVLHRKQEQGLPETQRVQCRRCAIGTEWEALNTNGSWNKWAALMVKESEAREKAVAASDGRHRTVEDATIAALKLKVNENDAAAVRWNAFCTKAGLSPTMSPNAAAERGENYKIHASIVSALREHLTGQLNERRIHDLFVALRKATKAFVLNAKLELPAHRDAPGELDGVALADAITKSVVARTGAAIEQKIAGAFARERAGSLLPGNAPQPLYVTFTAAGGYDYEKRLALDDGLVRGTTYLVLAGLVDRTSTKLLLCGVPGNGFNSELFSGVDLNHPCMHRMYR